LHFVAKIMSAASNDKLRLDPLVSLALGVSTSPGVYALLLGSGTSRSAGLPTGWEIVLDLIRRIATLSGQGASPTPESWYEANFSKPPAYSELLEFLGKTPAERQGLLRAYIEPNAEEREQGRKLPGPAHQAIARLVKDGWLRVIVTTNFDRLIEQALEAEGVAPTVISNPDAAEGALPLIHSKATVIKLHGDYLDTRIRNTERELEQYDARLDQLLDRVFDEFGLVVCGWSGEWDIALRRALQRRRSRRFSTFWAGREPLKNQSRELVAFLQAVPVPIADADTFFRTLQERIESLSTLSGAHPLSIKSATGMVKKFLSRPDQHRIALTDLVRFEVTEVLRNSSAPDLVSAESKDSALAECARRVAEFGRFNELLVPIVSQGAYWGGDTFSALWQECVERLANIPGPNGGLVALINLRRFSAMVVMYAGSIAALANDQYKGLAGMVWSAQWHDGSKSYPAAVALAPPAVFQDNSEKCLSGMDNRRRPVSDYLHKTLRAGLSDLVPQDRSYDQLFDKFEYLLTLLGAHHGLSTRGQFDWAATGRYVWHDRGIASTWDASMNSLGNSHPMLTNGLFDSSVAKFTNAKQQVDGWLARIPSW
jgi:hypothetical protein